MYFFSAELVKEDIDLWATQAFTVFNITSLTPKMTMEFLNHPSSSSSSSSFLLNHQIRTLREGGGQDEQQEQEKEEEEKEQENDKSKKGNRVLQNPAEPNKKMNNKTQPSSTKKRMNNNNQQESTTSTSSCSPGKRPKGTVQKNKGTAQKNKEKLQELKRLVHEKMMCIGKDVHFTKCLPDVPVPSTLADRRDRENENRRSNYKHDLECIAYYEEFLEFLNRTT